jgi:murein DD-endopeptidase MepM/ murein hydrolase activator NlpD
MPSAATLALALILAVQGGLAVPSSPALPIGWPVDDPHLVSGFRPPATDWQSGHRGVDLAARTGDPVRSMAPGVVGFAGAVGGKPIVTVVLAGGARLTYEPVLATLTPGTRVADGQVIGSVARAGGHCGGVRGCVHVGLRVGAGPSGPAYLDPLSLLERRPAILKPR